MLFGKARNHSSTSSKYCCKSIVYSVIVKINKRVICGFLRLNGLRALQKRTGIEDQTLENAIKRAEKGIIDADLGANVIKLRLSRPGRDDRKDFGQLLLINIEIERSSFMDLPKMKRLILHKKSLKH